MDKIYVTKSSLPPLNDYIDEIKTIWDSHWLTNMGIKHSELEKKLKDYLGVQSISLFVNGHMALELILQAMNLSGEVITTPFTFASTTHAIVRNGLTPVFCDINPLNYTIDADKIESLITDKTTAILPVHVYGNICDVEKIEHIAIKHNLKVIYDAAHAFGVKYNGVGIGNFGDASMFSFHATKIFHTIEGGAICYQDETIGQDLYKLKNFGIKNAEVVDGIGANGKMNEFAAAMGLCNLRFVEHQIQCRKLRVERYTRNLQFIKGIQIMKPQRGVEPNYSYFPILINEDEFGSTRDEVYDKLFEAGIVSRKYFYPLTSSYECFKGRFDVSETPIALKVSFNVLSLPLYPDLQLEDVDRICETIRSLCV